MILPDDPAREALSRWATRHRIRADEMRMKGKNAWAANNDAIAAHYEALAAEAANCTHDPDPAATSAEHGPGWLDPEGERLDREAEHLARVRSGAMTRRNVSDAMALMMALCAPASSWTDWPALEEVDDDR